MSPTEGIVALLVPLLLGAGIVRVTGMCAGDGRLRWCGTVFPVGALALALILFAFMAAGISVRSALPGLVAGLAGAALLFVPKQSPAPEHAERAHPVVRVIAALVAIVCFGAVAFVASGDVRRPVHRDDDALIWGLKARYLHHHEVFDDALGETLAEPTRGAHHLDYPLLNPLLQVWVTSVVGVHSNTAIRYPTMAWMVSLVFLLLAATRRRAGELTGALLTAALAGAGVLWVIGTGAKSDLITALALLGCLDAAARWIEDGGGARHVAAAALFAAILVWSKNEGIMLATVVLLAALMTRPRAVLRGVARPSALWFLVPVTVLLLQMWFNERYGLVNDLMTGGEGVDERPLTTMLVENFPARFGTIARAYAGNMAFLVGADGKIVHRFDYHHGLYLAFLLLVVACPRHAFRGSARLVTLTSLGGLAAYFLVYVISFQDLDWHLFTSLPRVQSHLLPGMLLGIAILIGKLRGDAKRRISAKAGRT